MVVVLSTSVDARDLSPLDRVYLTADSIKTGAAAYIAALTKSKFNCVLNDRCSVRGPWNHSMNLVINVWAPNATAAGLKYFAGPSPRAWLLSMPAKG